MTTKLKRSELTVCGWIHEVEKALKLNLNIPSEIINMFISYYHINLLRFDLYDETKYDVSKNGLIIRGKTDINNTNQSCLNCIKNLVYAESPINDGYKEGVHTWSIKCIDGKNCWRRLGVVDERNLGLFKNQKGWEGDNDREIFHGGWLYWTKGTVLTARLDFNKNEIVFFRDGEMVPFSAESLNKITSNDKGYYFVLNICEKMGQHFEIVDCPKGIPKV